jgi:hypothetical protein
LPHGHKPARCNVLPAGWRLAAGDASARIIKRNVNRTDSNNTTTTWSWRYCLRPRGRYRTLFEDVNEYNGYGDIITYSDPVLAGGHAAATSADYAGGGRYGCTSAVTLYDLRTGASNNAFTGDCDYGQSITDLVLNPQGFAAWRATAPPTRIGTQIDGVSCPSVSLCVAVDGSGNVLTSTDPTGGRADWSITSVTPGEWLAAVSCPTVQFCVAVSGLGRVVVSNDPLGGSGAWQAATIAPRGLTGISCPSASFCVAADNAGDVLVSTDPAGGAGAWTRSQVDPTGAITGVSCPTMKLCAATDYSANVVWSTDPNGGAWIISHVDSEPNNPSLIGITCPSVSLCVAAVSNYGGGDLEISTDPTGGASAWTRTHVDDRNEPMGGTCASTSMCVVFDRAGNVLSSTDPAGGPAAWSTAPAADGIVAVACPSVSLCVGVSNGGAIVSSTNPTGGQGAWSTAVVDAPACALSTPCIAEQLYLHDGSGTQQIDSAPPGTGNVIGPPRFSGNLLLWTHGGAPMQLTLP